MRFPDHLLTGWPSDYLMRPWFDRVAVRFVANWYFPLSRAWAAGIAADRSVDLFKATLGAASGGLRNGERILNNLAGKHRVYRAAETAWQDAFFHGGDVSPDRLVQVEAERFTAAQDLMKMRRAFLAIRKAVPQVDWTMARPADVQQAHGLRLREETLAFPAPASVPVEQSRPVAGARGDEFWLKMPSPTRSTGDTAWAHLFMPLERPVRGVVVSLHGVVMEPEMWSLADLSDGFVERGFCVIRPEGPWHGRRRLPGQFGGETVFARGVLGFIELFEAWVMETALWIRWAREAVSNRVSIGGVSLGALTGQIAASACHNWPTDMRPDGALLITTTGDLMKGALAGSLAQSLGVSERLAAAGWDGDELDRWRPLVEPGDELSVEPDRIVMALGDADSVTPYEGGAALARRWKIPPENLFIRHQGHFSAALGLYRDAAPIDRAAEVFGG